MADTNINIKPSVLITCVGVVAFAIMTWSLSIVYDNVIEKIDAKTDQLVYDSLLDKVKENREKIKVQWAFLSANKERINDLEKDIIRDHPNN